LGKRAHGTDVSDDRRRSGDHANAIKGNFPYVEIRFDGKFVELLLEA
jgi:hypothetical protein